MPTLAQLEAFVSSPHYDATTAGLIALGVPELPRLKGEQIAPGITRIRGNLCNVHGRYGPCDKAASGGKKPAKGRKPAKAAKPKQAPEQRTVARDAEHQTNRAAVFSKLGLFEDATAALTSLRDGKPVTDDGGLVKMGMAEQASDGSYRLTPTGRALMAAANAGDAGRARDIVSRGTDAQGKRSERATAQQTRQEVARQRQGEVATRRQAAAAERAKRAQERARAKPSKKPDGGDGDKKPEERAVERPRRAAPAKRVRRNSAPSIGGVAGASANKKPPPPPPKAVQPAKAPTKQIAPALQESVQALSDGKELSEADTQSLIRNGLAKLNKEGELILTAAGMRATQKEAPAHTGVMVALYPDVGAAKAIAAQQGVTEPVDELHLTLAFLGDSSETALATNKDKLIAAVKQWAVEKGQALKGTINGLGRFFHAEDDQTNAVFVSPDVPGLPELRQSLCDWIKQSGFDYAQNHGFTPHITVAYVPLDAPTPTIRIETPVTFSQVTLAWGDERYDYPLGQRATTKAQTAEDRAMFAKMGGGGSGGGGSGGGKGGGSKLWPKGPSGKRTPQAAAAQSGGGKGDAKPKGPSDAVVKRGHDLAKQDHEVYSQITALRREQDALRPSWGQTLKPKYRKEREAKHSELEKKINDLKDQKNKLQAEIDKNTAEIHSFKDYASFQVFKDASGRYRWVAQSSTAFQDRDKEIVSTKALADDCQFADETGTYGPLRWWHTPGLDLGDCDFNAMHGRVLIESGTFKSEQIALKVAQAAPQLEISLGFLHLPTEPDANGVFHHIRRFERSLVPRGKASNRFTAFRVKEIPMLDATKVAALKTLGFSDDDITSLQTQAAATEKSADAQQVAYKSVVDVPETMIVNGVTYKAALPPEEDMAYTVPQEVKINGVTYKALPPSPPTAADAVVEEDAIGEMPMEEEAVGGLTLSPEDLAAITEVFQAGMAQVMGALDLEKKVGAHVQGLMQPYQQAQTTKDAADVERAEQIAQLQTALKSTQDQLNELLGLQPAVKAERATESSTTTINPWIPQDQQLLQAIKHQVSPDEQFAFGDLVENLFGSQTPGQA